MPRLAELCGLFCICALALPSTPANAQADTTPPAAGEEQAASAPSVIAEVCPHVGAGGGRDGLPVDFFVRVSRFNALAVSPKGAQGIAQFMPRTADWRGLGNPFDVIAALKTSASYLRDLRDRFGIRP